MSIITIKQIFTLDNKQYVQQEHLKIPTSLKYIQCVADLTVIFPVSKQTINNNVFELKYISKLAHNTVINY